MKLTKIVCLVLITMGISSLTASASSDAVESPQNFFKLRVKAALTRVITPSDSPVPVPITFVGKGKAKADAHGVTIRFSVLDANGQEGTAKIRVSNPLEWGRNRTFGGKGAAKVVIGDSRFAFRLKVKGKIIRRDDGRLVLHGKFASRHGSNAAARFAGRFGGLNVVPVPTVTD